jgi:tRNA U55 pseudouridine synthase TruB
MIVEYEKNIGETMSELINRFRIENKLDKNVKVAYAGRLDPLAYGKVIFLTHNDIYKKDQYCNYDKIYQCDIIEEYQTDTFDIMGLPIISNTIHKFNNIYNDIISYSFEQEYPPFSSYKVFDINGVKRSLWYCSKYNIPITHKPIKKVKLFYAKSIGKYNINSSDLYELIKLKINSVKVNSFRQDDILKKWNNILINNRNNKMISISKWEFKISSGGYIRYLANNMNGTCFNINRIAYLKNNDELSIK